MDHEPTNTGGTYCRMTAFQVVVDGQFWAEWTHACRKSVVPPHDLVQIETKESIDDAKVSLVKRFLHEHASKDSGRKVVLAPEIATVAESRDTGREQTRDVVSHQAGVQLVRQKSHKRIAPPRS
eukprot:TRINITY_DN19601_c0_g1_i1.p2 TRINITY_DN19601_c0_g1~~TRINITY_DN19601_c0_g1_i1.p2  ORF type:complete len:124 (+),score=6.57 TRINITY_DN19601_c0_g1_i1:127-498(+)